MITVADDPAGGVFFRTEKLLNFAVPLTALVNRKTGELDTRVSKNFALSAKSVCTFTPRVTPPVGLYHSNVHFVCG